jgi:toxin ParE1/3/4
VKKYKVSWTKSAERDFDGIIDYILSREGPGTAQKIYSKIRERAARLERNPEQGRNIPELSSIQMSKYRELVIAPWRLIYRIEGLHVSVILLIDGRRNLEDILADRLMRDF